MTSLLASAGPGCGKTYAGTKLCRYLKANNKSKFLDKVQHTDEQRSIWEWAATHFELPPNPKILYAAYNADFVPEVKQKVPPSGPFAPEVRTIHGSGYKVLTTKYGYLPLNNNRGSLIVEKITGQNLYRLPDRFKWISALRYTEVLKEELLEPTPENFEFLRIKYSSLANMPIFDDLGERCRKLFKAMKEVDRKIGIEYIDQVWLPLFVLKSPKYDLGIIDECQDLSAARLLLCRKLCRNLFFIGDNDQGINAFAGADARAFEKIQASVDEELPLKLSFRNPPNIVNKANALMKNRIIPDTKPRTWLRAQKTEKGPETSTTLNELAAKLDDDWGSNLIMCRYNAPLIKCALTLTRAKVPCFIYGRSLISELKNIVKGRKAYDIDDLMEKLDVYEERVQKSAPPPSFDAIRDKLNCIRMICNTIEELDDFEDATKELIREDKADSVNLATIHKSKGREKKNCHILFPPIEAPYAVTPEQKQQEQNLHYVALTRTSYSYNQVFEE